MGFRVYVCMVVCVCVCRVYMCISVCIHTKSQVCLLLITPHKDSMAHILRFFPLLLQCRTPYTVIHGLVLLMMGIMMPKTCWDRSLIINIRFVASCWFTSLHPTFHDAWSQEPKTAEMLRFSAFFTRTGEGEDYKG